MTPQDRTNEAFRVLAKIRSCQDVEHLETMLIRRDATVSPVPLSVAPSRDTDGGMVSLSEVTNPDDNRIEVVDGSQKRQPSIRTFVGRSSYEGESARSLCLVPGKRDNGVVATGASGRHEGQSEVGFLSR